MTAKWLRYIIRFLAGDDIPPRIVASIGYTSDAAQFYKYNVVIIPSGFFYSWRYGDPAFLPALPLKEIDGIPLLFGTPVVERVGETLVVRADIIASTYFLITRYEEMVRRNVRDRHGRFPGKESLPFRARFINRPIVDEYRVLLRHWLRETNLRIPELKAGIRQVWLTHDVDAPFLYRSWKGLVRSIRDGRGIKASIAGKFGPFEEDPYYTFPWIEEQDNSLIAAIGEERCRAVYFFKGGGRAALDKPHYSLADPDVQALVSGLSSRQAVIGMHTSYEAGLKPSLITREREHLVKAAGAGITFNRHHFLACREPEDMRYLVEAGIRHDFTMGYADVAGFRLGTSYPVRWINPANKQLSSLTLHPLHIMDGTIEGSQYMNLPYEKGQAYCFHLIGQIEKTGGELSLLWHNSSFHGDMEHYHKSLYLAIINLLKDK